MKKYKITHIISYPQLQTPVYIEEYCCFHIQYCHHALPLSSTSNYTIPRLQTKCNKHAFTHDHLPLNRDCHMKLGAVPRLASFKQHLKLLFNTAFNSDSVMHCFCLHFCNQCTTNVSWLTCSSHTKSHTKPTACKWPVYIRAKCAVQFVNLHICTFSKW